MPFLRLVPMQTVAAFAFALLVATCLPLQAQPAPDGPSRPDPSAGEGRRPPRQPQAFPPGGQGLPMLEQVLTETQRDSVRQSMETKRETLRELQEKIRAARKTLMTAAFAEDYQEENVRAKALEVARLEADLTVIRLKAIAEVQPALSKEQLEKIMNPQPPRGPQPGSAGPRASRRAIRSPDGARKGDPQPQPPNPDPK